MPEEDAAPAASGAEDAEVSAISTLIDVLTPLSEAARDRVVSYVFARLGVVAPRAAGAAEPLAVPLSPTPAPALGERGATDIRSLKNLKQPHNSIEMAAVVAYYLAELAPEGTRKAEIGSDDLQKYFKQADYPLPGRTLKTLFDAKNAGYMDAGASRGSYKLNPVGHNLVAHGLPAKGGEGTTHPKRTGKKSKRKSHK